MDHDEALDAAEEETHIELMTGGPAPTSSMLVLEGITTHLPWGISKGIEDLVLTQYWDHIPTVTFMAERSWLFYCPDDGYDHPRWKGWDDLALICKHARSLGYDWLMLDSDAEPIEGLPTYDW